MSSRTRPFLSSSLSESAQIVGRPLVTYSQMREGHSIDSRLGHPELAEQIVFRSNDNGTILGLAAEAFVRFAREVTASEQRLVEQSLP